MNQDNLLGGYLRVILVAIFLIGSQGSVWAEPKENKPLVMGVFPIVSSGALFKRFVPLKDYLSQQLGREVILRTARDFPTFVSQTATRDYDIVITAPHFSLLATDSGDYEIVARPLRDLVSLMVVAKSSKITNISQLAGKIIATPPKPALSTRSGKDYLKAKGLVGVDAPRYKAYKTHNAAYQAVLTNDASAALVSINAVNKALDNGMPLRIIDKLPPLPAMPTLVARDLGKKILNDVKQALVLMNDTEMGRAALKRVGFPGYTSSVVEDYLPVRPYKPASSRLGKPASKKTK